MQRIRVWSGVCEVQAKKGAKIQAQKDAKIQAKKDTKVQAKKNFEIQILIICGQP